MTGDRRRREFLSLGLSAAGLAGLGGETWDGSRGRGAVTAPVSDGPPDGVAAFESADRGRRGDTGSRPDASCAAPREPVDVRGAAYLPARAYNFFQMWANYDRSVVERDLGYARRVNLNAVRTWVSYEFWDRNPRAHERAFDHFLRAASDRGIGVLVSLFEGNGVWPTEKHLRDRNPFTAFGVRSPGYHVLTDRSSWDGPRAFVEWFAERYRDDDRLLAIEVMNEPGWADVTQSFARSMFRALSRNRGRVPLTVGSTSMANNATYLDWGTDVLRFHYNFPDSRGTYRRALRRVSGLADAWDGPTWLTEWQRVRSPPFGTCPPNDDHTYPDYASLAPVIHDSGFGNFFWSLMVKPAYLPPMRGNGVLNGLFHEDGAVWSLEDARAIKAMSGDPGFDGEERREWPSWAAVVKEKACDRRSGRQSS
ncbi:MAG: glycoside hydrolase [Salinigranum sp.]